MSYGGDDRGPTINAVTWSLTGVATVVVSLRLVSRAVFLKNGVGLDDYITVFCLLVIIAADISVSLAVDVGLGKHLIEIPIQDWQLIWNRSIVMSALILWTYTLPKFAIIALLRRLVGLGRLTSLLLWGSAILCQCLILATSVFWFKQCEPSISLTSTVSGVCTNADITEDLNWVTSSFSTFLDLVFTLYPIPIIAKLNMSLRKRISVLALLGLGSLALVVSIYKMTTYPRGTLLINDDPTYVSAPIIIWSLVEANILIITSSLSTLNPLVRAIRDKIKGPNASTTRPSDIENGRDDSRWPSVTKLKSGTTVATHESFSASQQDDIHLVPISQQREFAKYICPQSKLQAHSHSESLASSTHVDIHRTIEVEVLEERAPHAFQHSDQVDARDSWR